MSSQAERRNICISPEDEEVLKLHVSTSPDRTYLALEKEANFKNLEGFNLCTINEDGIQIINHLFSGKTLGETLPVLISENHRTPPIKIRQQVFTFLHRLYARSLIQISDEAGEIKVPNWAMEPLTDVHLFITHKCNLDCIHCLIVSEKRKELTAQEFMGVVDDLVQLGCTDLDITGGEITTKRGFLDLIDHATSKNLSVGVGTNGTSWSNEELERLINLKPEKVNISIYSADSGVHDQITQRPGSFDRSVSLASRLIQAGIPVNFKCMIMRANFNSFETVARLAKTLGAGYQFDAHITSKTDGNPSPLAKRLSDHQLWKFVRSPWCTPAKEKMVTADTIVCNAGVDRVSINAYGDVHPCAVFPIKVGNVGENRLPEIWENSPLLNEIRIFRFRDFGKCGFCPLLTRCSPCPGASYLEQGNFRETPDWSCKLTKMIIEAQREGVRKR